MTKNTNSNNPKKKSSPSKSGTTAKKAAPKKKKAPNKGNTPAKKKAVAPATTTPKKKGRPPKVAAAPRATSPVKNETSTTGVVEEYVISFTVSEPVVDVPFSAPELPETPAPKKVAAPAAPLKKKSWLKRLFRRR